MILNRSILQRSQLLKDVSVLVSGTAVAQIIPVLLQPLLRRYFTPEDFGAYAVFLSMTGILTVVASLKYELAIVLPVKEKPAANLVVLTIIINFFFSILLLSVIILYARPLLDILRLPLKYSQYLYFVPAGVFLFSYNQGLNYWLIRKKKFFAVSLNKFIRRVGEGFGQLSFIMFYSPSGLVMGDLFGRLANVFSATIQVVKSDFKFSYITYSALRSVSKKYDEYPKYNVIPGFMSACSFLLPALFINRFFSTNNTGFFDLSKLMLSIPLALIATSISNVLLQRISEKYNKKESILPVIYPIVRFILVIAFLEIIVIRIWGVQLFTIFFGKEWKYSGELSRILVWSFAANFIIASLTSLFISMGKIKIYSAWQVVYFIAIFGLVLFKDQPFIDFLKTYVLIELISYFLLGLLLFFMIYRYQKEVRLLKPVASNQENLHEGTVD